MRAVLLHEAETEFWASVVYYEEQEPGLGVRFKLEVDQFIAKIEADPMQSGTPPSGGRTCALPGQTLAITRQRALLHRQALRSATNPAFTGLFSV